MIKLIISMILMITCVDAFAHGSSHHYQIQYRTDIHNVDYIARSGRPVYGIKSPVCYEYHDFNWFGLVRNPERHEYCNDVIVISSKQFGQAEYLYPEGTRFGYHDNPLFAFLPQYSGE